MVYLKLLISTPSDVLPQHLSEIRKVISQWNINSGESVGLVILPVLWTEHAVAEFGDRPQALLNTQIVKDADLGIAIFRDKGQRCRELQKRFKHWPELESRLGFSLMKQAVPRWQIKTPGRSLID